MEWKSLLKEINQNVGQKYDDGVHTLLDRMGLQEKRSTAETVFPMIGIFGAGIAVGATLGVLFAPKRGDALRDDLRHSLEDLQRKGKMRASEMVEREHSSDADGRTAHNGRGSESPSATK